MGVAEVMLPHDASPSEHSPLTARRRYPSWQGIRVAAWGLYMLAWGLAGLLPINPTDFDAFFLPSARLAASGHPFNVYQIRYYASMYPYPNANGPLSLVPLSAVAALAGRLGWLDDPSLRRMLAMAVFSLFSLLLAHEVLLAADRLREIPLAGARRMVAYGLILLAPTLWHSVLFYGHIEQPLMLWLALAAVRALTTRRVWQAGALLGLALLTRSAAIVIVVPLALVLARGRRGGDSLRLLGMAGAVVALGLAPFWLVDRGDLVYSLASFRGLLPVGGGTLWRLTYGTPLLDIAQHWDSTAILVAVLLATGLVLRARPDLNVESRDLYALLSLCALCFPLGIKTLWPYYFLDAYVLLAVWWLAGGRPLTSRGRWSRWLGLGGPAAAALCAQLAEASVTRSGNGIWDIPSSVVMSAAVLCLAAGVGLMLWWGGRRPATAVSGSGV